MADINIQRKKSSPSPWLLILLVLLVIGAAAYFLLRHDAGPAAPVNSPAPSPAAPLPDSTTGAETGPRPDTNAAVADMSSATELATPAELAAFAASDAATPDYGRRGLQMLSATLSGLADRADFRDAAISTRRDDLTSATSRLEEEDTSLRPGFTAATLLLQAMQQKGYPALEADINQLTAQADALTGRTATAQDQAALQAYLKQAARIVKALNEPPTR